MAFPFPARVVGAEVEVVSVDYDGDERHGLVIEGLILVSVDSRFSDYEVDLLPLE